MKSTKLTPNQQQIIRQTIAFVKQTLSDAEKSHDWWHIYRVWTLAKRIAQTEQANLFIVELGALLHDIADAKFYRGNEVIGPHKARDFLTSLAVQEEVISQVENIITHISFRSSLPSDSVSNFSSPELDVVQDADRLDAMGAIGIARAFSYGGYRGREIYNPQIKPNLNMTKDKYKRNHSPTINHFYEKLLLLKDMMNTKTGRILANRRHQFMEQFLREFYREWRGE